METRIEQRLVQQAKSEPEAFGELYEYYFPKIYSYVSYRVMKKEHTEDIVSLTFTKALEKLGYYSYRGLPFSAWLFRIAHNNIVDYYRRDSSGRLIEFEQIAEPATPRDMTERIVEKNEDYVLLRSLLAELPAESQNLLAMKFGSGLSNREIARTLGMPEGTVGSKIFRALKVLKNLMVDGETWEETESLTSC